VSQRNPYQTQVEAVLPRVLSLFDTDPTSPTRGVGDRFFWGWKLIDFANATFQGAAHGLARLVVSGQLPAHLPEDAIRRRIDAIVRGTRTLQARNGSVCEALPNESSYCVTALVAFDLLSAIELLDDQLGENERAEYLETVAPMIRFVERSEERHGFISNHLATAAAALCRWARLTGEGTAARGESIVASILARQSPEGWFLEYEGADPGYQSLATHYLADLHRQRPDLELAEPLARSLRFLSHFAHPDGSFGGLYGSRNTRVFYPAGVEALAPEVDDARALAEFMRPSIEEHRTVTLDAIDAPNLIPLFNSYCWAAALVGEEVVGEEASPTMLPCQQGGDIRIERFAEAGLLSISSREHYTIVSTHKGGVAYHYPRDGAVVIDAGALARDRRGRLFHTQALSPENEVEIGDDVIRVTAPFVALDRPYPTPFRFFILRALALTVMRSVTAGNWVKRALVRFLITRKKRAGTSNRRTIRLQPEFAIEDDWAGASAGLSRVSGHPTFSSIHMASQGYWQRGDDVE